MASIFVCGDIFHPPGVEDFIGNELIDIISQADYAIGNLEGVELPKNESSAFGPFQAEGTVAYLHRVGFDMLLLSNNHITDCGSKALQQTLNIIDTEKIDRIGAGLSYEEAYRPLVREIDGQRFAFINICEAQEGQYTDRNAPCGYAWLGYSGLFTDVEILSKKVEFTIVLVHLGLEHYELPLPEVRDFYRRLCDAGATCVIGGHPHVAQGYEMYGNKFIAYSLGNFYFPRSNGAYPAENTSFALLLKFDKEGQITINPIHHSLKNGIVDVEKENLTDINYLCNILREGYDERVNEMCVEAYRQLCQGLLFEATYGENEEIGIVELVKNMLRRSIFRKKYIISTHKYRKKILLRLFENESYRYTIIKALKEIIK